jgi:two-component system response regulator FixJ
MNHTQATVYVVDDAPSVRAGLARLLKSVGLPAKTFASAMEFLEQAAAGEPGCVIVDLRLPAMSGLELQDQLHASNLDLPVIFLTAFGTVPASVRALKRGALDFLEKPVDEEVLFAAIRKAKARNGEPSPGNPVRGRVV